MAKLSKTEWEIMEVLWDESPLSAREVHERMGQHVESTVQSVRTLLNRLLTKKAIARKRIHGMWVFTPVIDRQVSLADETHSFLGRFFGASPAPLVANLIENDALSDEDLRRLRALIDKATEGRT